MNNGPCWRAAMGMMGATVGIATGIATGNVTGAMQATGGMLNYAMQGAYNAYTAPGQPGSMGYPMAYGTQPVYVQQPVMYQPVAVPIPVAVAVTPPTPQVKGSCHSTSCLFFMKEVTIPHTHDMSCNQVSCHMFMKNDPRVNKRALQLAVATQVLNVLHVPQSSIRVFLRPFNGDDAFGFDPAWCCLLPIIRIEYLRRGRSTEQMQALVSAVTSSVASALLIPDTQVRTILYPKDDDEWAMGTTLKSLVSPPTQQPPPEATKPSSS
ncbi:hypothetical protein Pelo_12037 [Pelomyxa schiedti]|nr:hypothetical protein Pelo_12037 [Pelomyxa schiedti]